MTAFPNDSVLTTAFDERLLRERRKGLRIAIGAVLTLIPVIALCGAVSGVPMVPRLAVATGLAALALACPWSGRWGGRAVAVLLMLQAAGMTSALEGSSMRVESEGIALLLLASLLVLRDERAIATGLATTFSVHLLAAAFVPQLHYNVMPDVRD